MPYPFQEVNGRRVCCGRCRHTNSQERLEDGPFDTEAGLTFYCHDCHAVYAVCRICGWFMFDGMSCASCELVAAFTVTTTIEPRCRLSVTTRVEPRNPPAPAARKRNR